MESTIINIKNLSAYFASTQVLADVNFDIQKNKITAIMGPSGCGKTTLIRCINRLHELTDKASAKGKILLKEKNILKMNPMNVRRQIGMVFQRPNPFPTMSVYENVISGYTLNGIKKSKQEKDELVETSLKQSALWNEVKDNLHKKGNFLSGGQQQRLCISRALAMKPQVLLMDEPTSALDPKSTAHIEEVVSEIKKELTIVMVTHNISQASRISDYTVFMYLGELVEYEKSKKIFISPKDKRTEEYLSGKFG